MVLETPKVIKEFVSRLDRNRQSWDNDSEEDTKVDFITFEAPESIKQLAFRFGQNRQSWDNDSEEDTKVDFITPFFKELGWDVDNRQGKYSFLKEVVYEKSIEGDGEKKTPDYTFRYGTQKIFFVEAKKPSINIETDKSTAFQIRSYGWSANLSLCILTNFKQLAVYDTTEKPEEGQDASIGRINLYNYTDYVENWNEIAKIFHKESVKNGAFDDYINEHEGIQKGTSKVDDEFLKDIYSWRSELATNILLRNKKLFENLDNPDDNINYAVQLIINRIIFLRIAEDMEIENDKQLLNLLELSNDENSSVYEGFLELCKKMSEKYNSDLFHFEEISKDDITADSLTPILKIDDEVFKKIFENLYYPKCPYAFNVFPTELLGSIYEKFLRERIKVPSLDECYIEEKPESRSKEGIFPTPTEIARDIVKNTFDEVLEGKTPTEVSKMRFVDPACGSGTFLLEIFQYLMDWHLKYYSEMDDQPKNLFYDSNEGLKLTIQEKKRILLNNIYGVDKDENAIEVSKFSLLLKIIKDSDKEDVNSQHDVFNDNVLPFLANNIRCGNSLIKRDIYQSPSIEITEITPFVWEEKFVEVFERGGFDVVIGHLPFIKSDVFKEIKPYLEEHYAVYQGRAALYVYFFERGMDILKNNGIFASLCYNKYTCSDYGKNLRKLILDYSILKYNDYTNNPLFEPGSDPSSILIKKNHDENNIIVVNDEYELNQSTLNEDNWILEPPEILEIYNKILSNGKKIKDFEDIEFNYGAKTGLNKAFIINSDLKDKLINKDEKNSSIIKPVLQGQNKNSEVKKWEIDFKDKYLIFTRRGININEYPVIKEYLSKFKADLTPKPKNAKSNVKGRKPGDYEWYEIQDTLDYYQNFEKPKIIYPDIAENLVAIYDDKGYYMNDRYFMITSKNEDIRFLKSWACLLSSDLLNFMYRLYGADWSKNLKLAKTHVENLVMCDLSDDDKEHLSKLYDEIIELKIKVKNCYTPNKKENYLNRIKYMDENINQYIYHLYDLTEEDVKIIEKRLNQ